MKTIRHSTASTDDIRIFIWCGFYGPSINWWVPKKCVDHLFTALFKIRALALGMPGTLAITVSDHDVPNGTCATHVPWSMPGLLIRDLLWNRWRGKRSRNSWRMSNPQFYVSGKRPMLYWIELLYHITIRQCIQWILLTHHLFQTSASPHTVHFINIAHFILCWWMEDHTSLVVSHIVLKYFVDNIPN